MTFLVFLIIIQAIYSLVSFTIASEPAPQNPVIIGILSNSGPYRDNPVSGIKVTYGEYVETGGAIAIPIPWNLEEKKFNLLLESVNGVVFTGGAAFLWDVDETTGLRTYSAFQKRFNYVVDFVIQKKKKGIHYPLFGVCQGFESIAIALTEDLYILDRYVQFGKLAEIYFTPSAAESTMFQYLTQDSFDFLQENPTVYYWHQYALNTSVPSLYPAFAPEKWRVTGISKDDNGKEFLTAMESVEYPISMVMYHAERILWEANHLPKANHPSGAIYAIKLMAKSFVDEARKNNNRFEDEKLLKALKIQNLPTVDFGKDGIYYICNITSFDKIWEEVHEDSSGYGLAIFWILVIVGVILVIGYFGYQNYHKNSKKVKEPLLSQDDIELKQKSGF